MTPGPVVAVDIDLHRIHMVAQDGTTDTPELVMVDQPDTRTIVRVLNQKTLANPLTTILIEVASPHVYTAKRQLGRQAWTIWNTYAAACIVSGLVPGSRVLCAPSSTWTQGYQEESRHFLAGVTRLGRTKDQNHNLNECQAMIWFYRNSPDNWLPFSDYFSQLSAVRSSPRRRKSCSPPSLVPRTHPS